ncbi:capsular exopolysaccharide family [Cyclonatronum proteinivorum]|uniref:non-specific protein-tyrosine kinase n=1 Tax=Cyclonatronum proteinivorum TaxID=1457365 RepID=A0A345UMN6_9BACT|nr:polysaccharide biosynthesis tyrosine autokinase [Cyclonatronum proteinivorum]AXJ01738.1 capsular exopolysaccharide family [Cyclonatronum proteinivorum]
MELENNERRKSMRSNGASEDPFNPGAIPGEEDDQNDPFDPQLILYSLWDGKWIILACVVILGALGYYYTQTLPNQYRTTGLFLIENQRADRGLNLFEFTRARNLTWDEVGTEMQFIVNSHELAENVGRRLIQELVNPVTGDTLPMLRQNGLGFMPEEQVLQRLARRLPNRISLHQIDQMNLVEIRTTSFDPQEAAFIANFYIEEYRILDETITRSNLTSAASYLEQLEERNTMTLGEQDEQIRMFLDSDWTLITDEQGTAAAQELRGLFREAEELRFRKVAVSDFLDRLREEKDMVLNMLYDGATDNDMELVNAFEQAILDLRLQAESFYIEQPQLRTNPEGNSVLSQILRRIDYLEGLRDERLESQRDRVRDRQGLDQASLASYLTDIRSEIRSNEARLVDMQLREDFIAERVDDIQSDMSSIMERSAELQRLRRNQVISEELYLNLLKRLQETQIAIQSEVSRVREIRAASVPSSPFSPNRLRNYILSLILGFGLGAGIVLLRNLLDDLIHDPGQLRNAGFNVIGVIPDFTDYINTHFKNTERLPIRGRSVDVNLISLIDPISAGAEAYRRLRTSIEFSNADREYQTLVVTSSKPGEGKSLTSINLALTYAQFGKRTLVIDCDLRKPTIHKKLGLDKSPGLTDILFDKDTLENCLIDASTDNFFVITAGNSIPNPAETMGSKRMQELLSSLKKEFDIIILDTPPLLVVSDAMPLAVATDATVLVSKMDETELSILKETRQDLRNLGVNIAGSVLNAYDTNSVKSYYKYNYKYNYKYKYDYAYKDYKLDYTDQPDQK